MISYETLEKMEKYGGSFAKAIAQAYRLADPFNKKRLEKAFSDLFEGYKDD